MRSHFSGWGDARIYNEICSDKGNSFANLLRGWLEGTSVDVELSDQDIIDFLKLPMKVVFAGLLVDELREHEKKVED